MPDLTPDGRPLPSLAKARIFGWILIPTSLVMAYFWIYQPVVEAQRTGQLHYYVKGLLFPPALLYMGIAILCADLRDGQTRTIGPDGKPKLTRKGWYFVIGLFAVLGATLAVWYLYLHSIGFEAF